MTALVSRPRVHVVVTCSERKRLPVPSRLRLGSLTRRRFDARLSEWIGRLADAGLPTCRASDLYAGEHWGVARTITSLAAEIDARLWVCSAGYGLIPADSAVHPYAATFASGHADSVPGGNSGAGQWWSGLMGWEGPAVGPRSLAELANSEPRARVVAVLSAPYVAACHADLIVAAKAGNVSLISAGARAAQDLDAIRLPVDGRLQNLVGGTMGSLNVRVAARLLSCRLVDHDAMTDHLTALLAVQPPVPTFHRTPMTDDEIGAFIRLSRRNDPSLTHSRLLRVLRDAGGACEQSRFARLFRLEETN